MAKKVKIDAKDLSRVGTVLVRFVRDDAPFQVGQEKEFSPAEAEKFVRQGVADFVDGFDDEDEEIE